MAQPIDPPKPSNRTVTRRDGNLKGELFGEVVVFTGTLEVSREEAANLAASVGCSVATSPSKKTTMLVVGVQDMTRLAGKEKSSKHRKVEKLLQQGYEIQIISDSDFMSLVEQARSSDNSS